MSPNAARVYLALSLISNLALVAATVLAFMFYSTDAGIIVGAFCLSTLGISNAVLFTALRR